MTSTSLPSDLQPFYRRLESILQGCGPTIVAYSGGVDSGFLAYAAWRALGRGMMCVLAVSPSLAKSEEKEAIAFLERHGIPFLRIFTGEMDDERYRANNADRCYYCKSELFSAIQRLPEARRYPCIAHGANAEDQRDYRPGSRAAAERRVVAPLVEAGYNKDLIRRSAKALGLELWDKPAAPCLASRIPYFSEVTREKLIQIETAEAVLKGEGFRVCRVRHHGDTARVEVPAGDHGRIKHGSVWRRVEKGIKNAGFSSVELEPEGFRSGRLNDTLGTGSGS